MTTVVELLVPEVKQPLVLPRSTVGWARLKISIKFILLLFTMPFKEKNRLAIDLVTSKNLDQICEINQFSKIQTDIIKLSFIQKLERAYEFPFIVVSNVFLFVSPAENIEVSLTSFFRLSTFNNQIKRKILQDAIREILGNNLHTKKTLLFSESEFVRFISLVIIKLEIRWIIWEKKSYFAIYAQEKDQVLEAEKIGTTHLIFETNKNNSRSLNINTDVGLFNEIE
jgi:hypothetical protein